MYHSDKFGEFYMSKKEEPLMAHFMPIMMPESKTTAEDIIDIKDGDTIDLGGGVVIEVIELSGHTPGSVVFLDRFHDICFTGDAVGRGVWMQIPGALNLSEYKLSLERFLERVSGEGMEKLWFLGGHRGQEWGFSGSPEDYCPVTKELASDMAKLCQLVIDDNVDIRKGIDFLGTGEKILEASYGTAKMLFKEENRK
jgi:glyoxylase-like metal-dependent hydrolase (beta-lactamase superfamily II)